VKIAFVIPWYGDIPGGAEHECKGTAENMMKRGIDVEILTTCIKDFLSDWNTNYYKEGVNELNGVPIRRFEVRKRNTRLFDKINYKLMHNQAITSEEEEQFIREMVNSENLYQYIADNKSQYDFFIFIPYMFGTTYFGSKVCPEKSILIPCLHDESYAYMDIYKEMFETVRGLIFLSEPEKQLTEKIYGPKNKYVTLGGGIDTEIDFDPVRFRDKYNIMNQFMLYAGRRESGKNVPLLIDYFCKYKERNNDDIKLVLIGSGDVKIPKKYKNYIIDLGFIPKQDKYDAYAGATVLCQPSVNESFSIVIMESWMCNTPVLVHGDCAVTKYYCIRSRGGLYFNDYNEFEECIMLFARDNAIREKMGKFGRRYVMENYHWDVIVRRYVTTLSEWRKNHSD
jgi:glycosyltransferase involved in cell wall biosynthesis